MSDNGNNAPAGWYPDGQGGQRWWDGTQWGPEGQPPPLTPEPSEPPGSQPAEPPETPAGQDVAPPTTPMPTSPPPQYTPSQDAPSTGELGYGDAEAPGQAQPSYGTPYAAAAGFPPPGQDPSGAGTSGKNPKLLLAIIGGLVGVAVLVVILVLAFGGGNGPSSDDPAATVSSFFDAARDGDCDTAFELLTDNAKSTMGASKDDCASADPSEEFGDDVSIDIGDAKVDGDDATVPVSLKDDSGDLGLGEFTIDFALKKEGGAWLIDDFGFGSLLDNLPDIPDLSDFPDVPESTEFGDFPTDPFSDIPTDLFSDFPTDLFSDFPTDLFSDFPTDFNPEDFLSDFPTDLFSDFPTE